MPNSARLYPLTQLREQAGLTLTEMAQRCGLRGIQARKTVGDWETGQAIPRASRRNGVMRYLWHDLKLGDDPVRFAAVWQLLIEEWGWEPLRSAEREQLRVTPPASLMTSAVEMEVTRPEPRSAPVESPLSPDPVLPEAMLPVLGQPSGWLGWKVIQAQRHWLLITVPLLLVVVGGGVWWGIADRTAPPLPPAGVTPGVDAPAIQFAATLPVTAILSPVGVTPGVDAPVIQFAATLSVTATPTLAANSLLLVNGGFDLPLNFAGWNILNECDYRVIGEGASAHSGARYLAIHNRRPNCHSFFQDLAITVEADAIYRAAIWLRAPSDQVRRGRFALWLLGVNGVHQERSFVVANPAWTCLETTLLAKQPGHHVLRIELYLDSHDGLDYYFDSAMLGQGAASLCPAAQLTLADGQLVQPSGLIYPAATVGVQALVKNGGATNFDHTTFLRYWIAETEDGGPLDPSTNRTLPVPPLTAGESVSMPHVDLYLPINLPADQGYFVVVDVADTDAPDDFRQGFDRVSQPFTVTPCSAGTLYCDVPADHWAAAEIQAWFDAGISQGCRSNTEPFLNRPFCPDALVQRWMMVFFLLRRLEGKDYQPTNRYQGMFEDVPEDFGNRNGALSIEALTTQRVDMRSAACPPRGEHRRFCPNDPLRRVDFVHALLALQRWDLSAVAGTLFTDMATGSQDAQVAEYMARQGYLPEPDPDCPDSAAYRRFCPDAPLRRASAAVMMSRALGLVKPVQ